MDDGKHVSNVNRSTWRFGSDKRARTHVRTHTLNADQDAPRGLDAFSVPGARGEPPANYPTIMSALNVRSSDQSHIVHPSVSYMAIDRPSNRSRPE